MIARTSVFLLAFGSACTTPSPDPNDGSSSSGGVSTGDTGGRQSATGGGVNAGGGSTVGSGGHGSTSEPGGPTYHPPSGFENCIHAEVKADCEGGWCRIPAGCFVMGSDEDQWRRGAVDEQRTAATLTHPFLVQQTETPRKMWLDLVGVDPGPDPLFPKEICLEENCPITYVTWWEAVHLANLLSKKEGLAPCYEPVNCTGEMGEGLSCEGVADPEKVVYECEGYRLPTRHEVEYSARAGTTSAFYSGDITNYGSDTSCNLDTNLEKISWYCHNSGGVPHPGGQLEANGFGLFDQLGNVHEWVNDYYWTTSSPGGVDPVGKIGEGDRRLVTRGAFNNPASSSTVSGRHSAPGEGRAAAAGFRLARTLFQD